MSNDIKEHLSAARAALRDRPLRDTDDRQLGQALDELESLGDTMDPAPFIEALREWETRLEVDHPVLAGVLRDLVRKLGAMGI